MSGILLRIQPGLVGILHEPPHPSQQILRRPGALGNRRVYYARTSLRAVPNPLVITQIWAVPHPPPLSPTCGESSPLALNYQHPLSLLVLAGSGTTQPSTRDSRDVYTPRSWAHERKSVYKERPRVPGQSAEKSDNSRKRLEEDEEARYVSKTGCRARAGTILRARAVAKLSTPKAGVTADLLPVSEPVARETQTRTYSIRSYSQLLPKPYIRHIPPPHTSKGRVACHAHQPLILRTWILFSRDFLSLNVVSTRTKELRLPSHLYCASAVLRQTEVAQRCPVAIAQGYGGRLVVEGGSWVRAPARPRQNFSSLVALGICQQVKVEAQPRFEPTLSVLERHAQTTSAIPEINSNAHMTGQDRVKGFLARNSTSTVRTPDADARSVEFNEAAWYLSKSKRQSKFTALGLKREARSLTSSERGEMVTETACMVAT
ncbi:hypothetical protein PR048_013852 [Dryococelus australis]|uniref:Uncharacterized protein n=1 Tax=Dryococelus australis TaxID=614101 RepID=A0ABQ9HU70_9NEOP|nr:hypothetical protein PR048_013852 [Dryococelus australis]